MFKMYFKTMGLRAIERAFMVEVRKFLTLILGVDELR